MNVLLFHQNKEVLEMLSFCLEAEADLVVFRASSIADGLGQVLEDKKIDLVVTSRGGETDQLFQFLSTKHSAAPLILIDEGQKKTSEAPSKMTVLAELKIADVSAQLLPLIHARFKNLGEKQGEDRKYCRIKTDLLVRVVPLCGDIYVRLSNVKFIKLFREGRTFTREDLEKFLNRKKITYLYIRTDQSKEFTDKFKVELTEMFKKARSGDDALINTVASVQEVIHEFASRLGFTEEIQELMRQNIDLAVKAIGSSPKLAGLLAQSSLASENYITSHSVMLGNIACGIAARMHWGSTTTFRKLVMAALLHDFTFLNPDLARVNTRAELCELESEEDVLAIENHPVWASEMVKSVADLPGEVNLIVLQHHERPDGMGFPKGLKATQIAPLSAVLIVAHDILDAMNQSDAPIDFAEFLKSKESEYQGSVFRNVWKALNGEVLDVVDPSAA